MSKEKSVNKNNITKQHLTKEEIAQLMGLSVPTKATTSTQEIPLHKEIKNRLNEVMKETLCKEYSQYFFEIDETMVMHSNPNKKDDEPKASFVKGYQLVLPKDDCKYNGEKQKGYAIGFPTIYCKGLKTQDSFYYIKNGKTTYAEPERHDNK
jgi:hypothetical protein|tara:strand:+ start:14 stop:469 length:456 start_codon:yes stop_codon:yes gene_type:complete